MTHNADIEALAARFEDRAREHLAESTRCANRLDGSGLLANEYAREAWSRAAREVREVLRTTSNRDES